MNVYYSEYILTPIKALNRLSSLEPKKGIILKGLGFADFFPHEELGDESVESFLSNFKFQRTEYQQKCFHFLQRDYSTFPFKKFYNHQLWDGKTEIESKFVKYKLKDKSDTSYLGLLNSEVKIRLDANGLFDGPEEVPFSSSIEYIEDPMIKTDWSGIQNAARDFISGTPYSFYIHKPNGRFLTKQDVPVIFSSYLGHDLGKWLSYCELVELGDLSLQHGIVTENFYQEEKRMWDGDYLNGFSPDSRCIRELYQDLDKRGWKLLCTI